MTDWSLRLARAEDATCLPAIERSAAQAFGDIAGLETLVDGWTMPEERHRLLIAKGHCLTALVGGAIVGFLSAERFGRAMHIQEMSVDHTYQRCGIGAGLVRACGIDAANVGCECLTLTTFAEVPWNAPFYSRMGFERVEDLAAWPRLGAAIEEETACFGAAPERIAMVRFLP